MISSWLLPFVSGKNAMINIAQPAQTPPNRYILPWNPRMSIKDGKYFMAMNEKIHKRDIQNDTLASLIFSGIISEITINGNERIPKAAMKITNDKLATGIQLNDPTSKSRDFNII